mgnify:FL=1
MFTSRFLSIRQKLTLIIFMVSMVVLFLSSTISALIEMRHLQTSTKGNLVALSEVIAANGWRALLTRDSIEAEQVLNSVHSQSDVVTAYFFSPEGRMVSAYIREVDAKDRTGKRTDPQSLEMEAQQVKEGLREGRQIIWDEDHWFSLFAPVKSEARVAGYLYLRVEKTRYRLQMLWLILGWLVVLGIAAFLSFLLSRRMQGVISEPIEMLIQRMREVPLRHRREQRELTTRMDEFATLFSGFDEMVGVLELRDRQLLDYQQNLEKQVVTRTRELLEAKELAEAATEAKSRFLANVSHEIRTPMVGILGVSDLLRQSEIPEKEKQLAETVFESGEALLSILNDLLDLSKAEAGKLVLDKAPFSVQKLVESAVQVMHLKANKGQVRLVLDVTEECRLHVVGDAGRLRQVLLNLIGNALKFTEEGEVLVSVQLTPDFEQRLADVVIAVRDTGIGLRPDDQERIFESFEQADTSTTRNYGGTGLGLTIVRQLIEEMGGSISLESLYGEGSCFTVRLNLPFADTENVVAPELPHGADSFSWSGKRVLLAEDNPTTQKLLQIMLENASLDVHIVENGQEAITFLEQQDVDLVFMDCQMPVMDGLEAVARLRSNGLQTPVVALTAHAREEDEEHCLTAGMDDFLGKPFRKNELEAVLEKWLSRECAPVVLPLRDDAGTTCRC